MVQPRTEVSVCAVKACQCQQNGNVTVVGAVEERRGGRREGEREGGRGEVGRERGGSKGGIEEGRGGGGREGGRKGEGRRYIGRDGGR